MNLNMVFWLNNLYFLLNILLLGQSANPMLYRTVM